MATHNKVRKKEINLLFWYVILFLPSLVYGITIAYLHKSLPAFDDYIVQLEVAKIITAESFWQQIKVIFAQLNEHRIAYTRLWFLFDYLTSDKSLSYSMLILVGNLPLVGIWILLLSWMKQTGSSLLAMICIGWYLFQFQFFENSLWAMASLQNITIHFLYLLIFTLLVMQSRIAWKCAFFVAVITCYTSGNGFFVLGIGMLSLIVQRRWQDLLLWVGFTALLSGLYFYGYESNRNYSTFEGAPAPLQDKLFGFAAFLGQVCVVHPKLSSPGFIIGCGFIISEIAFVLCILASAKLWKLFIRKEELEKRHQFLIVLIQIVLFILFSAAILSHTRIEKGGYLAAIISRYQLYPTMLIICIFCMSLLLFQKKAKYLTVLALPVTIIVWLSILQKNLPAMYQFRSDILASFHNTSQLPHPDSLMIEKVFVPNGNSIQELSEIKSALKNPQKAVISPLKISKQSIDCDQCQNSFLPDETSYIVLYHPERQILYPIRRTPNAGFASFWLKGKLFENGFHSPINPFFYKAVNDSLVYKVGVLERKQDNMLFHLTNSELDFK